MKEHKKKAIEEHNRKFDKLQKLRKLIKGDKYEWVIRYCGSGMTEEQIDNWLVIYGEKK